MAGTPRPLTKIALKRVQYTQLSALTGAVVIAMTGNASFVTPIPALAALTTQQVDLNAKIAAWGVVGARGSHQDLINLRESANTMYNMLKQEAAYVQNTAQNAAGADYAMMKAIIISSGFGVKNASTPQGVLAAVQDLRRMYQPFIGAATVKLKWKKPIGLLSSNNVKAYQIWRSVSNDFAHALNIGQVTKTAFIDKTAGVPGTRQYYWIVGINAAGSGNEGTSLPINV